MCAQTLRNQHAAPHEAAGHTQDEAEIMKSKCYGLKKKDTTSFELRVY